LRSEIAGNVALRKRVLDWRLIGVLDIVLVQLILKKVDMLRADAAKTRHMKIYLPQPRQQDMKSFLPLGHLRMAMTNCMEKIVGLSNGLLGP
jgi:hypothetical protein